MPLNTKEGVTFFYCTEAFLALFPFVDAKHLERNQLSPRIKQDLKTSTYSQII
jgi:hypothetical protein